jgi:hypothetical protein
LQFDIEYWFLIIIVIGFYRIESSIGIRSASKVEVIGPRLPWGLKVYIPLLSFTITEDFLDSAVRRGLLTFTFEDIFFNQTPQRDSKRTYRAINYEYVHISDKYPLYLCKPKLPNPLYNPFSPLCRARESWQTTLKIGTMQVDTPGFPSERTCDFPVLLNSEEPYSRLSLPPKYGKSHLDKFLIKLQASESAMIAITIISGQSSSTFRSVESVSVSCKPFCLQVEDRLLDFVIPSLKSVTELVQERCRLLADQNCPRVHAITPQDSPPTFSPGSGEADEFHDAISEILFEASETEVSSSSRPQIIIPTDILYILDSFGNPVMLGRWHFEEVSLSLTLRIARLVYLAVDHSNLRIPPFQAVGSVSTSYYLGQFLAAHYTTGAIFQLGNPVRLLGSLELLGSPGSLAGSVGSGLKDFVLYPYQGIFQGPAGFVAGLGHGVSSLLKSITSGSWAGNSSIYCSPYLLYQLTCIFGRRKWGRI